MLSQKPRGPSGQFWASARKKMNRQSPMANASGQCRAQGKRGNRASIARVDTTSKKIPGQLWLYTAQSDIRRVAGRFLECQECTIPARPSAPYWRGMKWARPAQARPAQDCGEEATWGRIVLQFQPGWAGLPSKSIAGGAEGVSEAARTKAPSPINGTSASIKTRSRESASRPRLVSVRASR